MLVFRGTISTKGGGFASFRSSDANLGSVFAGASGVTLRGMGFDGHRYKVTFRTGRDEAFSYVHDFKTPRSSSGGAVQVSLRFADFLPSYMGQVVDAPPLRGEDIRSVGVLLSLMTMDG